MLGFLLKYKNVNYGLASNYNNGVSYLSSQNSNVKNSHKTSKKQ